MNKVWRGLGVVTLFIALYAVGLRFAYGLNEPAGFTGTVSATYPYTSIVYTWTVLDSLNQANADSLVIIDKDNEDAVVATMDSVGQTTYTFTGLVPNHTYHYAVAADSEGTLGESTPDTTATNALVFTMTAGTNPKGWIDFTVTDMLDTTGVAADTLCVVNADDSVIVFDYTAAQGRDWTGGTIDGLSPYTEYHWAIAARNKAVAGTHILSNADTLTTARVDYESHVSPSLLTLNGLEMLKATSHMAGDLDTTTVVLSGAADTESTIVYQPWKYNDVTVKVTGAADSCKGTILAYAGYVGDSDNVVQLVDSLNVTAAGVYHFNPLELPVSTHFYLKFRGDADNGAATTFTLRLNRDRH